MPPLIIVDAPPEENPLGNPFEATVTDLQTQLTAVQATIEGSGQSGLFKPGSFTGCQMKISKNGPRSLIALLDFTIG